MFGCKFERLFVRLQCLIVVLEVPVQVTAQQQQFQLNHRFLGVQQGVA